MRRQAWLEWFHSYNQSDGFISTSSRKAVGNRGWCSGALPTARAAALPLLNGSPKRTPALGGDESLKVPGPNMPMVTGPQKASGMAFHACSLTCFAEPRAFCLHFAGVMGRVNFHSERAGGDFLLGGGDTISVGKPLNRLPELSLLPNAKGETSVTLAGGRQTSVPMGQVFVL